MQRDTLLIEEMIDAAEQAIELVRSVDVATLSGERQRRDALLWNFTVLGEAAAQLSPELKQQSAEVAWARPTQLRNRIVHGYWSIDLEILRATAAEDLPNFVAQLKAIQERLGESECEV